MAYSQADLDKLKRALASGVQTVEYNGRRTTFRSQAELMQAIATVEAEVGGASSSQIRSSLAEFDRG